MEDLEKQFITSCKSTLTKEGKEICEEVLVMIGEKDEMVLEKAKVYCEFFLSYNLEGVNAEKLLERCKKYIEDLANFHHYKFTFKKKYNRKRKIV